MKNLRAAFLANAVLMLAVCAQASAQAPPMPEARFLPFADELRRARIAIGPEAECRVVVEEILARCELRSAGGQAIQIYFSDTPAPMQPRKSLTLVRGTVEPQQFSAVLAAYGIPTEVAAPCINVGVTGAPGYGRQFESYVGDYRVSCAVSQVIVTHARRF